MAKSKSIDLFDEAHDRKHWEAIEEMLARHELGGNPHLFNEIIEYVRYAERVPLYELRLAAGRRGWDPVRWTIDRAENPDES